MRRRSMILLVVVGVLILAPNVVYSQLRSADDGTMLHPSRLVTTIFGGGFVLIVSGLLAWAIWLLENYQPQGKFKRRQRVRTRAEIHEKRLAVEVAARPRLTDFAARGQSVPLMHEMITYIDGVKRFNKSVPIELLSGEFLGEFGINIAAPSVYARDKAAALEVWLFDKKDTKTASAILASDQILTDPARCAELKAKGSVLEAQLNGVLTVTTNRLRGRAKVLDFAYGRAPNLPAESFFDYVVLEIAIWQK